MSDRTKYESKYEPMLQPMFGGPSFSRKRYISLGNNVALPVYRGVEPKRRNGIQAKQRRRLQRVLQDIVRYSIE